MRKLRTRRETDSRRRFAPPNPANQIGVCSEIHVRRKSLVWALCLVQGPFFCRRVPNPHRFFSSLTDLLLPRVRAASGLLERVEFRLDAHHHGGRGGHVEPVCVDGKHTLHVRVRIHAAVPTLLSHTVALQPSFYEPLFSNPVSRLKPI
jgi:hypothetical protein